MVMWKLARLCVCGGGWQSELHGMQRTTYCGDTLGEKVHCEKVHMGRPANYQISTL